MMKGLKKILSPRFKENLKDRMHRTAIMYEDFALSDYNIKNWIKKQEFHGKIAVIKQDIYTDLYRCKTGLSIQETILSSNLRSGPVGLFLNYDVDFYILNTSEHLECQVWKEIVTDCNIKDIGFFESFKTLKQNRETGVAMESQAVLSYSADNIDWSQYDAVISFEISLPPSLTKKFPNVLWAYYISHPCMKTYIQSSNIVYDGYDVFLNQRFRKVRLFPAQPDHEIDFPYHLHYYGCFHELMQRPLDDSFERQGVFIEKHSGRILDEHQTSKLNPFGPLTYQSGSLENVINNLLSSKYFIRLGGEVGKRWGNSLIEAVASGCLILGNPDEFFNNALFTRYTSVTTFDEMIEKMNCLNNDRKLYERELQKQRKLLNYLCFKRPLQQFLLKIKETKGR